MLNFGRVLSTMFSTIISMVQSSERQKYKCVVSKSGWVLPDFLSKHNLSVKYPCFRISGLYAKWVWILWRCLLHFTHMIPRFPTKGGSYNLPVMGILPATPNLRCLIDSYTSFGPYYGHKTLILCGGVAVALKGSGHKEPCRDDSSFCLTS